MSPVPIPESLGLTCSLPVAVLGQSQLGHAREDPDQGAVIDFKAGRLLPQAGGAMQWESGDSSLILTTQKPVLRGWDTLTYDGARARWLPAPHWLLSPDGARYTYGAAVSEPAGPGAPFRIHVVDVATGADTVVYTAPGSDQPLAFAPEGIYVMTTRWEIPPIGLKLVDPAGQVTTVDASGSWEIIGGGAAWGFPDNVGGFGDRIPVINRLDLKTHQITQWFSVPAPYSAYVIGIDGAGNPIVEVTRFDAVQPSRYEVLTGPGQATPLFSSSDIREFQPVVDDHGLWFTGVYGVYLYSGGALHFVFSAPGLDTAAGPCT